jgi:hypothetical protein
MTSSLPHSVPSRMAHTVAALFGHTDDTLVAWHQVSVPKTRTSSDS